MPKLKFWSTSGKSCLKPCFKELASWKMKGPWESSKRSWPCTKISGTIPSNTSLTNVWSYMPSLSCSGDLLYLTSLRKVRTLYGSSFCTELSNFIIWIALATKKTTITPNQRKTTIIRNPRLRSNFKKKRKNRSSMKSWKDWESYLPKMTQTNYQLVSFKNIAPYFQQLTTEIVSTSIVLSK